MELQKRKAHRYAALLFLTSTILTTLTLNSVNFNHFLSLSGGLFTAIITTGLWLEVSYRLLIREATAPLDRLIRKL